MIRGLINECSSGPYSNLFLNKALDYMRKTDFTKFPIGVRTEIEKDNIYFIIHEYETKPKSERKAEVHQKYIDIHFILSGEEKVEVGSENSGVSLLRPYFAEQDAAIYEHIIGGKEIILHQSEYVILFPGEIHCAGITIQTNQPITVKKVVFKVIADKI